MTNSSRSSHSVVLGMIMSVAGLVGAVRSAMDGEGIWRVLGAFGLGVLGLVIVVSYFVGQTDRR
ncbi:hypothetical protein [Streptomyces sp. NPDC046821]|uniref:hypothetical protein n=1 Tax=Streptomyces sp. NPDC046821 TaxID=3154702 RepID=UPI00341134E6